MSHMETLILAPDGYSLGFSSSSIPSCLGGSRPSSASGGSGRRILQPQPVFHCLQAVGAHVLAELKAPGHTAFALGVAEAVVLVPHQPTQ